jgi:uncharacterized membrane protein YfcA
MDLTQYLILALIGISAGFIGGSMGVGGGVIMIPALIFFMGFSQKEAQGTSLAVLSLPVLMIAAINYYKEGYINIKYASIIIVTFILGGYLGSKFALYLPSSTLKKYLQYY